MLDRLLLLRMQAETALARRRAEALCRKRPRHAPPPEQGPWRVLMLSRYGAANAGTKYRLSVWAERLRARGHDVELVLPWGASDEVEADGRAGRLERHRRLLASRLHALRLAADRHLAIVHISDLPGWEYGDPWVAECLARSVGRLVIDLDDLPVVRGETTIRPRMRRMCELADALVLGNEVLPTLLPPRPWGHVPTCVEPAEWPNSVPRSAGEPVVFGWVGTSGNLRYLEALAPVLREVCDGGRARLRVICDRAPQLPGVAVDFVKWSFEGEVRDLVGIDVGLAPLDDGPMERCKCGLKALQYMAAGAAVVASPVGALTEIVEHGRTGSLATAPEDWRRALVELRDDPELRRSYAAAGRESVRRHWSFDVHEAGYVEILRSERGCRLARDPSSR